MISERHYIHFLRMGYRYLSMFDVTIGGVAAFETAASKTSV